jgi:hypothetical protein
VKDWPLRSRLGVWTAFLLTIELIIFGVASGWVIYQEQLEAFREIKRIFFFVRCVTNCLRGS